MGSAEAGGDLIVMPHADVAIVAAAKARGKSRAKRAYQLRLPIASEVRAPGLASVATSSDSTASAAF